LNRYRREENTNDRDVAVGPLLCKVPGHPGRAREIGFPSVTTLRGRTERPRSDTKRIDQKLCLIAPSYWKHHPSRPHGDSARRKSATRSRVLFAPFIHIGPWVDRISYGRHALIAASHWPGCIHKLHNGRARSGALAMGRSEAGHGQSRSGKPAATAQALLGHTRRDGHASHPPFARTNEGAPCSPDEMGIGNNQTVGRGLSTPGELARPGATKGSRPPHQACGWVCRPSLKRRRNTPRMGGTDARFHLPASPLQLGRWPGVGLFGPRQQSNRARGLQSRDPVVCFPTSENYESADLSLTNGGGINGNSHP